MLNLVFLLTFITTPQDYKPVYVINDKCTAYDVWAKTYDGAATKLKTLLATYPTLPAGPIPEGMDPDLYKLTLSEDRSIYEVWYVSSVLPGDVTKYTIPTYDQWNACTDKSESERVFMHQGYTPQTKVEQIGKEDVNFDGKYRLLRVYTHHVNVYVWYDNSANPYDAARDYWITNGVYALKKPLIYDDIMTYQTDRANFTYTLPKRKWTMLLWGSCYSSGTYNFVSTQLPPWFPPYDWRDKTWSMD